MSKKVCYCGFGLSLLLTLYFIDASHGRLSQALHENNQILYPFMSLTFFCFLFGILIEWEKVFRVFKGQFHVRWVTLAPIMLFLFYMVPSYYWVDWAGYGTNFFYSLIYSIEINIILSILAGILFVRFLHQEEAAEQN